MEAEVQGLCHGPQPSPGPAHFDLRRPGPLLMLARDRQQTARAGSKERVPGTWGDRGQDEEDLKGIGRVLLSQPAPGG